ncbi:hypothetical protein HO757_02570 [Streptococcus suis]|uniref:Uncharacterized protein n=1 Tax=Streptococcus suis TaxID=1307 RepID=A0A0Z8QVS8_STRSU|nr:hypothetical protein [Streptococcus suis]NQP75431.1 hypothetical protein [Streptococcus suis]NQP77459.1 hypothetical protein [Streptococcus suis]NQP91800.1 hypothetical protein [Streptococcus suis]NQP93756.1 hypothetical protein [Streptococcus suis]NQS63263.1 hypothetical protein [Streptococcus suis]
MNIEEQLKIIVREKPELFDFIFAFITGKIPKEERDYFLSLSDEKDRAEWVKQQIAKQKNIERGIDV